MQEESVKPAQPKPFEVSARLKTLYMVLIVGGGLLFLAGFLRDTDRMWYSFLTSYFFFFNLALGGFFIVLIQHVAKAGWSVTVRRLAESMTSFLPIAVLSTLILFLGAHSLYPWLDPDVLANDALTASKTPYLNWEFFVFRTVLFCVAMLLFAGAIIGRSLKQDQDGDEKHTLQNVGLSIACLMVFSILYSTFSFDTLMTMEPHWYSTIWPIFTFAGMAQSSFAFLILLTLYVMRKQWASGWINIEHVHDLAKYLKGFTIFYAYIGFSQFLLIWYANIPEETMFFLSRSSGEWMVITMSLLLFKFAVPFLLLLPRAAKRNPAHLVFICSLILVMQYIDVYWVVYPHYDVQSTVWSWQELSSLALFSGLFLLAVTQFLSRHSIVPVRDPRVEEALNHHVTY